MSARLVEAAPRQHATTPSATSEGVEACGIMRTNLRLLALALMKAENLSRPGRASPLAPMSDASRESQSAWKCSE